MNVQDIPRVVGRESAAPGLRRSIASRREEPKIAQDGVRRGGRNPGKAFNQNIPPRTGRVDTASGFNLGSCNCPAADSGEDSTLFSGV
jgi:hypothetical protein